MASISKSIVYDELAAELEKTKARMAELEEVLKVNDVTIKSNELSQLRFLEKLKSDINKMDDENVDALIKAYVLKVIAYNDHIDIAMAFPWMATKS